MGLLTIAVGALVRGQRDAPVIAGWIMIGVGALAVVGAGELPVARLVERDP